MANLKINNQIYNNITGIEVQKADGSGNIALFEAPSGTTTIQDNGTYNVTNYDTAIISVTENPHISINNGTIQARVGLDGIATKTISSSDDSDFISANIKQGVNIFGVDGSLPAGTSFPFEYAHGDFVGDGTTGGSVNITYTIPYFPCFFMIWCDDFSLSASKKQIIYYAGASCDLNDKTGSFLLAAISSNTYGTAYGAGANVTLSNVTLSGATLKCPTNRNFYTQTYHFLAACPIIY